MTIKKYKTFEEAEEALWCLNPDEKYFKNVLRLFDNRLLINIRKAKRGVFKYKTFEEAEEERLKWLTEKNL